MFIRAILFSSLPTRETMLIEVEKGGRDRWRWMAYKDGKYKSGCTPYGFSNKTQAIADAIEVFSLAVTIQTEDGEQFAGERDFN